MKTRILLAACWLAAGQAYAQFTGQISYEIVRRIDPSQLKIVINGEPVKPGDPGFPTDLPDSRTFGQKSAFAGKYVKEVLDDQNTIVSRVSPQGGPRKTTNLGSPFHEHTCVDLDSRQTMTFLTIKGAEPKTYKMVGTLEPASVWQLSDQTKKIAGYLCRKAIVQYKNEAYTVWLTDDIPATYSPVHALTPGKGVVLLIEGTREQVRATRVQQGGVSLKDVEPVPDAQDVSKEEFNEIREKALADFRQQKMMPGDGGR